jgi:hypothetical protein
MGFGSTIKSMKTYLLDIPPNGRLFVPTTYYQDTGSAATTLNGANDAISFSWLQQCDMALSSFSIYVAAASTPGNLNISLYSTKADGTPNISSVDLGAVNSGIGGGYIRHAFGTQQLYRNTRYHLVVTGSDGASYTIAYRRNSGTIASGFSDMAKSWTKLDGGVSWTALTQDVSTCFANYLVILNSTSNHSPSLWYGQWNGQNCFIPNVGQLTIPSVGISLDCQSLIVDIEYYIYGYSNNGSLAIEASTTVPVSVNGIYVKTGAPNYLLLGLIFPQITVGGAIGPLDCEDSRMVANVFNKTWRPIGKRQLYIGTTTQTTIGTSWTGWNNSETEWKVSFLSWESTIDISACAYATSYATSCTFTASIGMDSVDHCEYTRDAFTNSYGGLNTRLVTRVENGAHYVLPISYCSTTDAGNILNFYTNACLSSFMGVIYN